VFANISVIKWYYYHRHPIGSPEEAGKPDFAMVAG
jgi:hypothetical protein